MLLKAPDATGPRAEVKLASRYALLGSRTVATGKWHWEIWAVGKGHTGGMQWLTLSVDPVWDPGLEKYPGDLGVRVGYIACLPST